MRLGALSLCLVLGASALSAQGWDGDQPTLLLPPTVDARTSDFSAGILAKTPVERLKAQVFRDPSGVTVTAESVTDDQTKEKLWEFRWEPGTSWGPGTWVAFRDGLGRIREVRIILLEGADGTDNKIAQPGTWVRLVPQTKGRGSRLDLFIAGRLVTGGWTVAGSLLDVMASPDSWLWDTTSSDLDWGSVLPLRRWEDEKVEALRAAMHKALLRIPLAAETVWLPDTHSNVDGTTKTGAPWGEWKTLSGGDAARGLGPWGVTLWATNGVLRGWKADFVTWNALQQQRIVLPGYSQAFVPDPADDPAFAANWVRNLGLTVFGFLQPARPAGDTSADVAGLPYLSPVDAFGGYALDDVPALIHLLAVTRPGQAYLATINVQGSDQGSPSRVSFLEPAVILPWVGQDNRVRVVVYGGPTEQTWDQWVTSFPQTVGGARGPHVLLTALPLPQQTVLPRLPIR